MGWRWTRSRMRRTFCRDFQGPNLGRVCSALGTGDLVQSNAFMMVQSERSPDLRRVVYVSHRRQVPGSSRELEVWFNKNFILQKGGLFHFKRFTWSNLTYNSRQAFEKWPDPDTIIGGLTQ